MVDKPSNERQLTLARRESWLAKFTAEPLFKIDLAVIFFCSLYLFIHVAND